MAIIKTSNTTGKYHDQNSYNTTISYITRPDKTPHQCIGMIGGDIYNPVGSMELVALHFGQKHGVQVRHFILSFEPDELMTLNNAYQIGQSITFYLGNRFQAIYAVHEDKPQLHIHIIINAVSYVDGAKYRGTHKAFHSFMDFVRHILRRYGITKLVYVPTKHHPRE